jgi:hypothetical protein
MGIAKVHKHVALIEIDIDRIYHTRHGLHFNKSGKLLFSNKITQKIYSILCNEQKQSTAMSEKYENQGDESEVDGKNPNQENKDIRNMEDIIRSTENCVDRNGEERSKQDESETIGDNSDDKNDEGRCSQIHNKVIPSQGLECDGEKESVHRDKTVTFEQTQDITDRQTDSLIM